MKKAFINFVCISMLISAATPAMEIVVDTYNELTSAVTVVSPGDTIVMKDGIYAMETGWSVAITTPAIVIKSQSGNREKVIVQGRGMTADEHHGFWVSADKVTIRDITIQNVRNHCIQTDVETDSLRVINCILRDAGEQILKVPKGDSANPSQGGLVEQCLFEYSAGIGPQYYIGGIDCHFAKDWVVRNNVFKYIRSPQSQIAEHAVHFWNNSEGTVVEKNLIIDCDRGIGFGLGNSAHNGGIIRNNIIYHRNIGGVDNGDAGIILETSPKTAVYNNTIIMEHNYANAIEYRFVSTNEVFIANNLTNKRILARDGATGADTNNVVNAVATWFTDAAAGNLHLASGGITEVIDRAIPVQGLTDDYDGHGRPQGAGIDIGADEYYPVAIIGNGGEKKMYGHAAPEKAHTIYSGGSLLIQYSISRQTNVRISVYDMKGSLIKNLYAGRRPEGLFIERWDAGSQTSGVYICVIALPDKNTAESIPLYVVK